VERKKEQNGGVGCWTRHKWPLKFGSDGWNLPEGISPDGEDYGEKGKSRSAPAEDLNSDPSAKQGTGGAGGSMKAGANHAHWGQRDNSLQGRSGEKKKREQNARWKRGLSRKKDTT